MEKSTEVDHPETPSYRRMTLIMIGSNSPGLDSWLARVAVPVFALRQGVPSRLIYVWNYWRKWRQSVTKVVIFFSKSSPMSRLASDQYCSAQLGTNKPIRSVPFAVHINAAFMLCDNSSMNQSLSIKKFDVFFWRIGSCIRYVSGMFGNWRANRENKDATLLLVWR